MQTVTGNRWLEGLGEREPSASHIPAQALVAPLAEVARVFRAKPFRPHRLFPGGHAQTLAYTLGVSRPREERGERELYEPRLLEVEPGVRLLLRCRWQALPQGAPTVVLLHGLEGSSDSHYVIGTSRKAFRAGFNVVRVNMRTCGGSEHLSHTLYHSGMTGDIDRVVRELQERDGLRRVYVAGYSMSGNMVLKLAGEYGERPPAALKAVCAVSPSVDLSACADAFERRANLLYRVSFMRSLRGRLRRRTASHPELYDARGLRGLRTIRQFDNRYTAPYGGYRDSADYYARASSLPVIPRIRVPTLVVHAADDPLIPGRSFRDPSFADNPHVLLVLTPRGGHVGFVSDGADGEDRRWAENRVVEFFRLLAGETVDSRQ